MFCCQLSQECYPADPTAAQEKWSWEALSTDISTHVPSWAVIFWTGVSHQQMLGYENVCHRRS